MSLAGEGFPIFIHDLLRSLDSLERFWNCARDETLFDHLERSIRVQFILKSTLQELYSRFGIGKVWNSLFFLRRRYLTMLRTLECRHTHKFMKKGVSLHILSSRISILPFHIYLVIIMFENHYKSSRCLKITEKVSFNIASEANYVYALSGQKFIKNCQKCSNLASF